MLSRTTKYVHQLVNINIYIKMHGATIKIDSDETYSPIKCRKILDYPRSY